MTFYKIVLDEKGSCKGFILSQNRYKNGIHTLYKIIFSEHSWVSLIQS